MGTKLILQRLASASRCYFPGPPESVLPDFFDAEPLHYHCTASSTFCTPVQKSTYLFQFSNGIRWKIGIPLEMHIFVITFTEIGNDYSG